MPATRALVLPLLLLLYGCGNDGETTPRAEPQGDFCRLPRTEVDVRVETLLGQMTLAEKVEQMHGRSEMTFANGLSHTADNRRLGIPGFGMVDGPRGVNSATGHATAFPVGMARGATWDPSLEERVGEAIGEEARAKGGNVLLAPVVAIVRHPRWGRSQETYGEDSLAIGRMGVGFIHGAQRHVIASAKHFALNSIEDTRNRVNVEVDERTLREIYLPHFRMAVQDGHVASVMSAYNRVNNHYCAESSHLLHDILKGEWGFEGFVESDWVLGTRSTVPSALAGLDIEMPIPLFYGDMLIAAVENGDVPVSTIDAAVRRILRTKLCFELDSKPPQEDASLIESTAHTDLALEVARKAIVLLKNDNATLPLKRAAVGSIAVVGTLADTPNIGDGGSSAVDPSYVVTPFAGIRDHAGTASVHLLASNTLSVTDQETVAAVDAVVVVVGTTSSDEGEAHDRTTLELASDQQQLITSVAAINPNTIVVLEGGSSFIVESWIDHVPAMLMAWYPGLEGGHALADILFGDVNPSAKLPLTFARSADDLPPFDNHSLRVTYGYYHGYHLLDHNGVEPRFAFGFGLSYTRYRYSNLRLADSTLPRSGMLQVSADITNSGNVSGDEIAQLYIGYQGSGVDRPVRDLRGFAKVHLEKGQTRSVTFDVAISDLAYYDVDSSAWHVEPITYRIEVGPSSRDLPLQAMFSVHD
ncbi:MAG: glycoside hydrolase family 3 C-terminal domain-containing protein [Deltaproteobacteria bacterium]|nr:glycoside hydrolase family 3 C-terminal domain-containing protein [Deltaproteobacteria bacterium]